MKRLAILIIGLCFTQLMNAQIVSEHPSAFSYQIEEMLLELRDSDKETLKVTIKAHKTTKYKYVWLNDSLIKCGREFILYKNNKFTRYFKNPSPLWQSYDSLEFKINKSYIIKDKDTVPFDKTISLRDSLNRYVYFSRKYYVYKKTFITTSNYSGDSLGIHKTYQNQIVKDSLLNIHTTKTYTSRTDYRYSYTLTIAKFNKKVESKYHEPMKGMRTDFNFRKLVVNYNKDNIVIDATATDSYGLNSTMTVEFK